MAEQRGEQSNAQELREQAEAVESGQAVRPDPEGLSETSGYITSLQADLESARAEAEQYKDRYLRERAEMENFRKRQERLSNDRNQRYKRDMLEKVLEVADNLDRAMLYINTMEREGLQQTLRMVQSQLNEVLRSEGLTPVEAVGAQFDPRLHEAIESVASPDQPEGAVVEEVRKGYLISGDLLRPARVRVSAGPEGK